MKRIISITLFMLAANLFAQKGKTIAKEPTTASPVTNSTIKEKASTNNSSGVIILTVDAALAPCESNASIQCLQVLRKGANAYETIEDIEGFAYELGYSYTIQVKEILKSPPIAVNESMYKYKWIKTLSKKEEGLTYTLSPDVAEQPAPQNSGTILKKESGKIIGKSDVNVVSPLDNKWYLRKIKDEDGTNLIMDDNVIFMVINTFNDRIDGFGACNKFASVIRTEANNTFSISKLTNDYGNCNFKKTENLFFELLKTANKFSIRNGNLILYNQTNFLMAFTSNPNYNDDIITTYSPEKNPIDETIASNLSDEKNTSLKEQFTTAPIKETKSATLNDEIKQPLTTTNTSVSTNEEDEIQKQIDALEKKKAEKIAAQQKAAAEAKKAEGERIAQQEQERLAEQQRIVEEEAKKAEEERIEKERLEKLAEQQRIKEEAKKAEKERIEKEKQEKLAEQQRIKDEEEAKKAALKKAKLEELARLQAELEAIDNGTVIDQKATSKQTTTPKQTSTPKESGTLKQTAKSNEITLSKDSNKKETTKNNTPTKKTESKTSPTIEKTKPNTNNFTEIEKDNFVYYLKDKKYKPLEETNANATSKGSILDLGTQEASIQFIEGKLPKMMVKLNSEVDKDDFIYLTTCDFKKDKRQVPVKPLKNKINIKLNKTENNIFEIILPDNIDIGEYAFVTKNDINSNTNATLACFGIGEVEKNKKELETIVVNNNTPNNNTTGTNTINQVASSERVESPTDAEKPSELKYRRSSLYTLMVDDPSREYAETIKESFTNAPFPDKFNNHNLDIRDINGNANSKEQKVVIDEFLNTNDIARELVAKWFNRSKKGTFNMDLIAERGQYDASEMDVKNAKNTTRGLSLLADAGEELIKNTFVVITDFKYTNKEDVAAKTKKAVSTASAFLRFIPGAGSAVSIAETTTNTTLTVAGKGYFIKATSYLYRLHWDEAVAADFYNNYWIDDNSFDKNKKNAFDNTNIFTLDYIGSEIAKEQTQSSVFTTKTEEELIAKATVKSVDQVIAKLQRNHDEFKTKTPLYNTDPIAAKIGLKEGLEGGDKYEVLEQNIDKNGKTFYKRISVITVDKKNIWDNRYMASEEKNNNNNDFTIFSGKSKGLYIGMLIKQIK